MQTKTAVIIGAGVGGMATAIRLALQGIAVSVYEKNAQPGGKLTAFEQAGFKFDAGPSLFTQPENVVELFELAGEPMEAYFCYQAVPIACKYFFENGKIVLAHTDADLFAKELQTQLQENPATVINYLKRAETTYNHIGTLFLNHSLHRAKTWCNKRIGKALQAMRLEFLFTALHDYNARQFASPEAVQLFNRFATYNGSNPYKAPSMLSLIPHLEQNQGTYYPLGGMISITNALHRLAVKLGVQFYFNAPVQRILHDNGRVKGVVVKDENIASDLVVSNGDVYFTYKNLLNDATKARNILKQERSSSAVIFYWGINKSFSSLQLHNIFFSASYKEEFDHIFNTKTLGNDPTVYINITSKMEAGARPEGQEKWVVNGKGPANTGEGLGRA